MCAGGKQLDKQKISFVFRRQFFFVFGDLFGLDGPADLLRLHTFYKMSGFTQVKSKAHALQGVPYPPKVWDGCVNEQLASFEIN